jgi:hypothetical protein
MTARSVGILMMSALVLLETGQVQAENYYPITTLQVARALSSTGLQIAESNVSLAANVVADQPNSMLDILSFDQRPGSRITSEHSGTRAWVKLGCRLPARCVPFYAVVIWPETTASTASNPSAKDSTQSTLSMLDSPIIMRAGAHATLVMDDHRAQIQIAVISLENGCAGRRIRVASPDHKQIYTAEVVSDTLVKAGF